MKYLVTLVTALFLVSACNSTKTNTSTNPLHGKWTIDSYSAFAPNLPTFSPGDVVWNFDCNKSTVTVIKKDANSYEYPLDPGTYPYKIVDKKMMINGADYNYSLTNGKLKLDSNTDPRMSADGPVITFARM